MTTTAVKPPFADASPAEIRAALPAEDQPEFDRQWREALTAAAGALSLDEVHGTLESWRRVAWLVSAHGPDGYRRMMAQAQETLRTGQSPPGSVGIEAIEALGVLKLIPWNGEPISKHNPAGPVRTLPFGTAGMVT